MGSPYGASSPYGAVPFQGAPYRPPTPAKSGISATIIIAISLVALVAIIAVSVVVFGTKHSSSAKNSTASPGTVRTLPPIPTTPPPPLPPNSLEETALCNGQQPIARMPVFQPKQTFQSGVTAVATLAQPTVFQGDDRWNIASGGATFYADNQAQVWIACLSPVGQPVAKRCGFTTTSFNSGYYGGGYPDFNYNQPQQTAQYIDFETEATWKIDIREMHSGVLLKSQQFTFGRDGGLIRRGSVGCPGAGFHAMYDPSKGLQAWGLIDESVWESYAQAQLQPLASALFRS